MYVFHKSTFHDSLRFSSIRMSRDINHFDKEYSLSLVMCAPFALASLVLAILVKRKGLLVPKFLRDLQTAA